eukprot:996096-Pyramimonas_sp.AAC.1
MMRTAVTTEYSVSDHMVSVRHSGSSVIQCKAVNKLKRLMDRLLVRASVAQLWRPKRRWGRASP